MKICNTCGSVLVSGIHFEDKRHNLYTECPKCHERNNGKSEDNQNISFKELLLIAAR